MKKITPLHDYVLISPQEKEAQTASGIYIPDSADGEKSQQGTVEALGSGDTGDLKEGATVLYKKYGGEDVTIDQKDYTLIKAEDVIAIIE